MMKLGMEIPIRHLNDFSALCDVDFALAHLVLENEEYRDFYRGQSDKGRIVILDNSFHELGHPLSPIELRKAAREIKPSVVIAPDKLGALKENYMWYKETKHVLAGEFPIGAVLCGHDVIERVNYATAVREADMWLFPFRENRLDWFHELCVDMLSTLLLKKIHLLGVSSLDELLRFRQAIEYRGVSWASYDTSKPIKFGITRQYMDRVDDLRTGGFRGHDATLDDDQIRISYFNIAYMRRYA